MLSLAALYGSIVIGWIAYQNYQPKLLVQFHFDDFTFLLTLAQAVILVVTPPLAGKIGDRYRFEQGHRIPVITAGISFASMVFMAVAFTLFTNPGETFRWILPVLIIFWLIAMSIFTSPALSTMELFSPVDKLPLAMAILTIVANLIYAVEPVIVDIIDYIGAPLTFISGGAVVFVSGLALKKNSLTLFARQEEKKDETPAVAPAEEKSSYGFIFFMGVVLGTATTVLFNLFPDILEAKVGVLFNGWQGKIILVNILVLSAVISWPVSNIVNKYGLEKSFWLSFALIMSSMLSIFVFESTVVVFAMMVVFTTAFTSLSVSSLPMAIQRASFHDKVFCVGIFFSGVALPDGILESIQAF
jgi:MFS family permease